MKDTKVTEEKNKWTEQDKQRFQELLKKAVSDDYWKAQEMGKSDDCYKHEELAYQRGRKEALEDARELCSTLRVAVHVGADNWQEVAINYIKSLDTLISKEKRMT